VTAVDHLISRSEHVLHGRYVVSEHDLQYIGLRLQGLQFRRIVFQRELKRNRITSGAVGVQREWSIHNLCSEW